MEQTKIYTVPRELSLRDSSAEVIGRTTDPTKKRVLMELDRLMIQERGRMIMDLSHPLHPRLVPAVGAGQVEVLHPPIELARTALERMVETMQNVHLKEPQRGLTNHPCDFTEATLLAAFQGPEIPRQMLRLQAAQGVVRRGVIPKGLIVTRHFSPELDLALLAVRKMFGSDGDHLEDGEDYHYEGFFPASAW